MHSLRRITDGVLFQAVLTGSLSFSHIHDLAAAHGQSGWKAWLYPLSVDLLTVAAYRRLMAARRTDAPVFLAWCAFLLGLEASLAANVISAWQNPDRLIAVALGVWPAVAFLVCTLLSHDPTPRPGASPVTASAPVAVPATPAPQAAPVAPAPTELPAPRPAVVKAAPAPAAAVTPAPLPSLPEISPAFLEHARRIADEHQTAHGSPIDFPALHRRLKVHEPVARAIHNHLMTQPVGA
jgi:hypothetical protein